MLFQKGTSRKVASGCSLALVLLLAGCASTETVVLLPEEDGSVGKVVVASGDSEVVLDQPLQGAQVSAGGVRDSQFSQEDVDNQFGEAIAAQPTAPKTFVLYFEADSVDMTADSESDVKLLFEEIDRRNAVEVVLVGHTDTMGSSEDNDELSLKRAEFVRQELVERGLSASVISVSGRGERELVRQTADEVEEAVNRRVEVTVR